MKLLAALAVAAATLPFAAHADRGDIQTVRDGQNWAGCVYQEGFAPYPIQLSVYNEDFVVNYPGICVGRHVTGRIGNARDADEIIDFAPENCVPDLLVDYRAGPEGLRIDWFERTGQLNAYAFLQVMLEGDTPPACSPSDAIS